MNSEMSNIPRFDTFVGPVCRVCELRCAECAVLGLGCAECGVRNVGCG